MKAQIYTQSQDDFDKEEALGIPLPLVKSDFYFNLNNVSNFYMLTDDDDEVFIRVNINGLEYPLIYTDSLYDTLVGHFTDCNLPA
jgi:hypothetical protein